MIETEIMLPTGRTILISDDTAATIAQSAANYATPLWQYRAEKVLKLGEHQWIFPQSSAEAQSKFSAHPFGITCFAWKLFNRGYLAHAEAYFVDTDTYPHHPRHLGRNVVPLVDEDANNRQIGWAHIDSVTHANAQHTIFVQFTILDMFPPRPLPAEYS